MWKKHRGIEGESEGSGPSVNDAVEDREALAPMRGLIGNHWPVKLMEGQNVAEQVQKGWMAG